MTDEKWQEVKGMIKDKFTVIEERTEPFSEDRGPGETELIIFLSPMGKVKLERTSQPLVLDKKTFGSKRIGSYTKVEYVYSDSEKVHKFRAYTWNEADQAWAEFSMEKGSFFA